MDAGLNNYLKKISSGLFLKYDADERRKIEKSIANISNKLVDYFDDQIDQSTVFGSYTRDTILPRQFDQNSDIDILIQFNVNDYEKLRPESYRNQLKRFAEVNYTYSGIIKDHPSVIIQLQHIKFDLVPSIFDVGLIYDSIEIPDKDGGWMETNPRGFDKKLNGVNSACNSIIKPIIRLLKYWNATHGYPYYSFELESEIADMDFNNDNYESGFLYAIETLSGNGLPLWARNRLDSAKSSGNWISEYLHRGEIQKAKSPLDRILPNIC